MPEKRRKFDAEFREGAVRLVRETGKLDRPGQPVVAGAGHRSRSPTATRLAARRPDPPEQQQACRL